ncbi:hypothetical protein [Rugamonas apoptosis]|uniref:Transmembrane protein n=1 Tax=Rugamonas apoptosis TaxID=2758570 RepID=A0A7W2FF50_9BURK|nr:hypothetical protein [Rugamonas apoptosis]MBA5690548.1 hypothetical protein [Rugamonas apoptosis]
MRISKTLRMMGRLAIGVLAPWRVIKRDIDRVRAAAREHEKNIHYIRDLARRAAKPKHEGPRTASFDDVMRRHTPASIARVERRFLFQKRLALGTAAVILVVSACAIANGRLLGIATIIASMPLFFMASFSAHFRLWQLRNRRLSAEESGGLDDFFAENPRWIRQVLDPELGNHGEE